mmetsp:Transcript_17267/g.35475  ORF Transcript_17267/g.35475 Transcript_17267/m.35475 type:complete len:215 (-) Transcript_17267:19-663(-)
MIGSSFHGEQCPDQYGTLRVAQDDVESTSFPDIQYPFRGFFESRVFLGVETANPRWHGPPRKAVFFDEWCLHGGDLQFEWRLFFVVAPAAVKGQGLVQRHQSSREFLRGPPASVKRKHLQRRGFDRRFRFHAGRCQRPQGQRSSTAMAGRTDGGVTVSVDSSRRKTKRRNGKRSGSGIVPKYNSKCSKCAPSGDAPHCDRMRGTMLLLFTTIDC